MIMRLLSEHISRILIFYSQLFEVFVRVFPLAVTSCRILRTADAHEARVNVHVLCVKETSEEMCLIKFRVEYVQPGVL